VCPGPPVVYSCTRWYYVVHVCWCRFDSPRSRRAPRAHAFGRPPTGPPTRPRPAKPSGLEPAGRVELSSSAASRVFTLRKRGKTHPKIPGTSKSTSVKTMVKLSETHSTSVSCGPFGLVLVGNKPTVTVLESFTTGIFDKLPAGQNAWANCKFTCLGAFSRCTSAATVI
jgi:hypothetical protein